MIHNNKIKKIAIIGGVCVVLLIGVSVAVPRILANSTKSGDTVSLDDESPGTDNAPVDADSSELPDHGAPEEDSDTEPLTPYDARLAEDAAKYGVSEISGTFTTYVNLNFREGPATKYDIISTSPKGSKISIIGRASNGWYQVVINDVIGYMCDEYLNGQGKLELNTFDMDRVVKLALKKATASGNIGTIEDWLDERVKDGRISPEEYTLLSPTGKGSYYCASFEVSSKNFCSCDGTILKSEDEVADYLVSRFIDDSVKYCYFENHGTYEIGGKSYYEIRCYTRTGKSDFAKSVEENIESGGSDNGYTMADDYTDEPATDDSSESSDDTSTDDSEEEIDYNNTYTE